MSFITDVQEQQPEKQPLPCMQQVAAAQAVNQKTDASSSSRLPPIKQPSEQPVQDSSSGGKRPLSPKRTFNSISSDTRRNYPRDHKERKQEWWGIDRHKAEVHQELARNETEIRNLKQRHINEELEKKMLSHYQQRQMELGAKLAELNEIKQKQKVYLNQLKEAQTDKQTIQRNLAKFYEQQRQIAHQRDQEYKKDKRQWEQQLLDYNRRVLESAHQKEKEQREYAKNELQKELQRNELLKDYQKQQKRVDQQQYNQLIRINEERERNKEQNYKYFFEQCQKNQEQLRRQHYEHILAPLQQKEQALEQLINKGCSEYQQRRAQEELERIHKQKAAIEQTRDKLVCQIQAREHERMAAKQELTQKVKERLEDLANYQEYQVYKQGERELDQRRYKEFLDQQSKERSVMQQNASRMSKTDKSLNKLDLQAYKLGDTGLYSMQVGWSPQIGQLPPRQSRDKLAQEILSSLRKFDKRSETRQKWPEPGYVSNFSQFSTPTLKNSSNDNVMPSGMFAAQHGANRSSVPVFRPFQKIGEPDRHFNQYYGLGLSLLSSQQNAPSRQSDLYKHNPITNPMPFSSQNKYIQREFFSAKPSIFQQLGQATIKAAN